MLFHARRFLVHLMIAVGLCTVVAGTVGFASDVRMVLMEDQCDPETFDATFGPGTCVRPHPGVSFSTFITELLHTQSAGGWMFGPREMRLREGVAFQAQNNGGEVHTFTEVDEFGGGFIPELNELSGNPEPALECLTLADDDFIPPGGTSELEDDEEPGTHHYQCCIHPWMRMDVTVRP